MERARKIMLIVALGLLGACSQPGGAPTPALSERLEPPQAETPAPDFTATSELQVPTEGVASEPTAEPAETPAAALEPAIKRIPSGEALTIQQIAMSDSKRGWGIGGSGDRADSVLRTEDGGRSWMEVSPPEFIDEDNPLIAVGSFLSAQTAWVLYHPIGDPQPGSLQELLVWRTDDGGDHWRRSAPVDVEFIGSAHAPARIHFSNEQTGWILARYGGAGMHRYPIYLLGSRDGGVTWQVLEDPYEGLWLQSCPKTGWDWLTTGLGVITIGFCPFESAEIHLSIDFGQEWESIRLPIPESEAERLGSASCEAHSPILLDQGEVLLASFCPVWGDEPATLELFYHSVDGGRTWQIREYPGGTLLWVDDSLFALGREIHRSDDRGRSWTSIKQVAWDGQFSFISPADGWAVARAAGEIAFVHTMDGGATWQIVEPVLSR